MNLIQLSKFLWDNRKGTKYILRTGKIPLCECKEYLKDGDCNHIALARETIREFINKK